MHWSHPLPKPDRISAVLAATAMIAACDPAARTTIRVSPPPGTAASGSRLHVSTPERDAVVNLVTHVAEGYGLDCSTQTEAPILVRCVRSWESNENGHARSIQVWVSAQNQSPTIEVVVMEWLAFRHTSFGRDVLDELNAQLRTTFGSAAVSALIAAPQVVSKRTEPLQPTRAAEPNGQRASAGTGPRG